MNAKKHIITLVIILSYNLNVSFGQTKTIKGIEIVFVKGGWFDMGGGIIGDTLNDESTFPIHKVFVNSFYIGKYEITNKQYCDYLNKKNFTYTQALDRINLESRECKIKYKNKFVVMSGFERYPVNFINYMAAAEFCKDIGGRLPTEAEWEYAAKGGEKSKGYTYSGSNIIEEVGVTLDNFDYLKEVGSLKPNELNIYDMSGNVSEMYFDWHDPEYFKHSTGKNPMGPDEPIILNNYLYRYKVVKGCRYELPALSGKSIISLRGSISDDKRARGEYIGFRIQFPINK